MIDWGLFTENHTSKNKSCDKVVYAVLAHYFLENQNSQFVRKNKEPEIFTMLNREFQYIVQLFLI